MGVVHIVFATGFNFAQEHRLHIELATFSASDFSDYQKTPDLQKTMQDLVCFSLSRCRLGPRVCLGSSKHLCLLC